MDGKYEMYSPAWVSAACCILQQELATIDATTSIATDFSFSEIATRAPSHLCSGGDTVGWACHVRGQHVSVQHGYDADLLSANCNEVS